MDKKMFFAFLVLFSVAIGLITLLYESNVLLTLVLVFGGGATLWMYHERQDVLVFVVGGVIGPIGEGVAVYFGAWSYTNPSFFGIPIWLPIVWGLASLLITRIAKSIT